MRDWEFPASRLGGWRRRSVRPFPPRVQCELERCVQRSSQDGSAGLVSRFRDLMRSRIWFRFCYFPLTELPLRLPRLRSSKMHNLGSGCKFHEISFPKDRSAAAACQVVCPPGRSCSSTVGRPRLMTFPQDPDTKRLGCLRADGMGNLPVGRIRNSAPAIRGRGL